MDDKNLNETPQTNEVPQTNEAPVTNEVVETTDVTETVENATESKNTNKKSTNEFIKKLKSTRIKKLKNELLFKKGSYSMAITACILVAVILVNWLVGALADRFNLEFDMTTAKNNSLSKENIEYVKGVDNEISIIFCADENSYAENMAASDSSRYVSDSNSTNYYTQTVNIVKKYAALNKKIKLEFIDTQDPAFASISLKYPIDNISYGDIIVSCIVNTKDGSPVERHKIVNYDKIYNLVDESGYAAMGYGGYTIGGNDIETQLTSAIAFVQSAETKKVALLTGHSTQDYSSSYAALLEENNYEVDVIEDSIITELSDEYDVLALVAPNIDFMGSEIDVISAFLDNNGKLKKGLIYFTDATVPALENFNAFLLEWGIEIGDAMLYETNAAMQIQKNPYDLMTIGAEDEITKGMYNCITGFNVPILAGEPSDNNISVTELMITTPTLVEAPKGSTAGWKDYSEDDIGQYVGVIQAEKVDYDSDTNEISSYIMAFSSVEYIYSDWAEFKNLSNKNIVLAATDRAADVGSLGISFISKTISSESFADSVVGSDITLMTWIFVILMPVALLVTGIVIFIRRKNA